MTATPKPADLRTLMASALAGLKAYDLPAACVRLGLAGGEESEAMSSKFKYAHSRLMQVPTADLSRIAHAILEEISDRDLDETLAKYDERTGPHVSEITRRHMLRTIGAYDIVGRLRDEIELLEPVFPLDDIPSIYPATTWDEPGTLRDDITRHCIRNSDWSNVELLTHAGLLTCSRKRLFALVARLLDPVVRDEEYQRTMADLLSELLERDGYTIREVKRVSGFPIFGVVPTSTGVTPADRDLTTSLEHLDEAGIHALWQKALSRRDTDPEGAITIARTLIERTCKHILDESRTSYPDDVDLPKLYALTAEQLNLAPNQHTEQAFKAILGNCQSIVNYLGTLRNRLGDSHAQGGKPVRPKPRHAQLVVNLAGTMATFLATTWAERETPERKVGS